MKKETKTINLEKKYSKVLQNLQKKPSYFLLKEQENIPKGRYSSYGKSGIITVLFQGIRYQIVRSYKTLVGLYDYKNDKYFYINKWSNTTCSHLKSFINNDKLYYDLKKEKFRKKYFEINTI